MKESSVEKYLNKIVKEVGGFTRKWVSPGHVGVEDRICFLPNGEIWFIEMKRPGKFPTAVQWREIMRQRDLGHNAGYLSSEEEIDHFFKRCDKIVRPHCMRVMLDKIKDKYAYPKPT